jgi:hypothetical protein
MFARFLLAALALALAFAMAGCAIARVEEADVGEIPDGPPTVVGGGFEPISDIFVVGTGRTNGVGWRYSAFESTEGWCTQFETARFASSGCGDFDEPADSPFRTIGIGESGAGFLVVDGVVTSDVEQVWIETAAHGRLPAQLLALRPAGMDAQAFVVITSDAVRPVRAIAIGADGQVLETAELR